LVTPFEMDGRTIAWYSAAISDGLREVTRRDRGGIPGRWTKPVAASPVHGVASKAKSLSRTRLGELYPASAGAASVDRSSREATWSSDHGVLGSGVLGSDLGILGSDLAGRRGI